MLIRHLHSAVNAHREGVTDGDEPVHCDADEHPHGHCLGHQSDGIAVDEQMAGQSGWKAWRGKRGGKDGEGGFGWKGQLDIVGQRLDVQFGQIYQWAKIIQHLKFFK